jgi:uncharacterized phage protein (TIGR02218 family)
MRDIPPALQAKLDAGATTLCRCWLLTRRDGAVQGFTDHDRDLVLNGILCRADTGFGGTEATSRLGLAVDGSEIAGALSHDSLDEAALAAGRYDAARVDLYLVDWSEPELHLLIARGSLGEVRRQGAAFTAELRSLADALAQEAGRLYGATCSADLGDARCGVALHGAALRGEGVIAALRGVSVFVASGLDDFDPGWFGGGRLVFTSGDNAGNAMEVKRHHVAEEGVVITLWQAMAEPLAAGNAFVVTAGCDKRFATCRDRFVNAANFRGFPHIPGNDFILRYAVDGEPGHDGRSLTPNE